MLDIFGHNPCTVQDGRVSCLNQTLVLEMLLYRIAALHETFLSSTVIKVSKKNHDCMMKSLE